MKKRKIAFPDRLEEIFLLKLVQLQQTTKLKDKME